NVLAHPIRPSQRAFTTSITLPPPVNLRLANAVGFVVLRIVRHCILPVTSDLMVSVSHQGRARSVCCPYCRGEIPWKESEKDHVPPKSIFHTPPPKNLITVKCCPDCHDNYSKGDDLLKLLVSTGKFRRKAVRSNLPSIKRSIDYNPWWLEELIEAQKAAESKVVITENGYTIGKIQTLQGESKEAVKRSIWRIAVGLIFKKDSDFNAAALNYSMLFARDENPWEFHDEVANLSPFPFEVELGGGDFYAKWVFPDDSREHCIIYLSFYGGANCVIFFTPPD
ncbi:HNH endonuclease, partial [Roseibacillus persicicus]|uniref:HNH endonuclease n=1 Tax=Roseibacillus persicicus TaxID=454148 RepID=UPI00280DA04C